MRYVEYDENGKIRYCELHPNLPVPCITCVPEYVEQISSSTALSSPIETNLFHVLWDELHKSVRTKEQFEAWAKRVPCGACKNWLRDYVRDNPPTDDLREYGWRLHNAVNAKLSKTFFTWPEFETKYPDTT